MGARTYYASCLGYRLTLMPYLCSASKAKGPPLCRVPFVFTLFVTFLTGVGKKWE